MKRFLMAAGISLGIAGVAYLTTLGCCRLMAGSSAAGWTERIRLTPEQRRAVAEQERQFLARKQESCGILCAKRAQMIQLLKQTDPDQTALLQLAEEIGQEQTALEKATVEHLVAVSRHLEPEQRLRMMGLVSEDLRTACAATACGMGPGCSMKKEKGER